eukprot:10512663-Heterocapsa_arctica.AAC.1
MSDGALEVMGLLMVMTELQGSFPDNMAELLIRLIPKPVSGRRAVALFKSTVRMWYKVRQKLLQGMAEVQCAGIGNKLEHRQASGRCCVPGSH